LRGRVHFDNSSSFNFLFQVAHRSALANAMYQGCRAAEPHVTIHFGTTVVGVDFDETRVLVKEREDDGEGHWINADVVLGADGVKSVVRKFMLAQHGEDGDGGHLGARALHFTN
jgi:salicylate hydroxylase